MSEVKVEELNATDGVNRGSRDAETKEDARKEEELMVVLCRGS